MTIFCFLLVAACTFLAGCVLNGNTQPPPALTAHEWDLQSFRDPGGDLVAPLPGSIVTLTFSPAGDIHGKSGCNSYHGTYSVEGELLTVQSLASTEMYCPGPEGLMAQEERYLILLSESTRYQVLDNTLILSYYDIRKHMVFTG